MATGRQLIIEADQLVVQTRDVDLQANRCAMDVASLDTSCVTVQLPYSLSPQTGVTHLLQPVSVVQWLMGQPKFTLK